MKRNRIISILLIAAITGVAFMACKKSSSTNPPYTCAACTNAPEALAANDASSKGIYKGVFTGSTGTIKFDVLNAGTTISAVMVIDGTTINLTSVIEWISGQPYVAPFTGTLNGSPVTINFAVNASGGSPVIVSSDIPGHPNAAFILLKETSVALVEAFEGSYSTTLPETGIFNMLISRTIGSYNGVVSKSDGTDNGAFDGTIDDNGKMTDVDGTVVGTLTEDEVSGTSQDSNGSTVTIKAKRTL